MKETLTFEGIAAKNSYSFIPDLYGGLHWDATMGAVDRTWINKNVVDPNGYDSIIHGKAVAYTGDLGGYSDVFVTADAGFTPKSGTFAADFSDDQTVVFLGYRAGVVVATMSVVMTMAGQVVTFDHDFKNIDALEISTDPADGGTGGFVTFDDWKVVVPDPAGAVPLDAHHFSHQTAGHPPHDSFDGMLA